MLVKEMCNEIIIEGEFTIEGLPTAKHFKQPLKYCRIRIGEQPSVRVEEITSK